MILILLLIASAATGRRVQLNKTRQYLGHSLFTRRTRGFTFDNSLYGRVVKYTNAKKLYSTQLQTMMIMSPEGRVTHAATDHKNTNSDFQIDSVDFVSGSVVVTIKGIESGRYLAGRERSSQVYGSLTKRDHIRWRIQIEPTGEQRFVNEATGRYLTFATNGRVRQHHFDLKHEERMHFVQFTPTII